MSESASREPLWSGPIAACRRWVDTPVLVESGRRYAFSASGRWRDASIECDADGHDAAKLRWLKWLMRYRGEGAVWFTLIGAVDRDPATMFAIGTGKRLARGWLAPRSGKLCCFANDACCMYWNNHGEVRLEMLSCAS